MLTILTASEITRLAQRLSETPLGRSASVAKAAERFQRLLVAKIGAERGACAVTTIMAAATADQAEARLTLVLNHGNPEPTGEPVPAAVKEQKPITTPAVGKRQAIVDQAVAGALPPPPDFSKPTHARFRAKLAQIVALAEAGNIDALQAFEINPVSSSPKAMARYRDLCVTALQARISADSAQ